MKCTKCGEVKELTDFDFKDKKIGRRRRQCKGCVSVYTKEHYLGKRDYYLEKAKKNAYAAREKHRHLMYEYLTSHPCVDCGENDPIVLDFDHLRDKFKNVGVMVWEGFSWSRIMNEIAKCEAVCSNCHRRRTARRSGWFKLRTEDGLMGKQGTVNP